MNSLHQSMTEPSPINGVSSTTNGDPLAHVTDHTQVQHHFQQLQSANLDKSQSISAGMCQYSRFNCSWSKFTNLSPLRWDSIVWPADTLVGRQSSGKVWRAWRVNCSSVGLRSIRLRTANVLLITMRALANEIAKNLVLAGIGSLTVQDSQTVVDDDLGAQFFVSEQDIGKNVWNSSLQARGIYLKANHLIACRVSSASNTETKSQSISARWYRGYYSEAAWVFCPLRHDHCNRFGSDNSLNHQRFVPPMQQTLLCIRNPWILRLHLCRPNLAWLCYWARKVQSSNSSDSRNPHQINCSY